MPSKLWQLFGSVLVMSMVAGRGFAAESRPEYYAFPYKTAITKAGTYTAATVGCDFVLSGTIAGAVKVTATQPCRVTLNNVTLTGSIAITGDAFLNAVGSNTLVNTGATVVSATGTLTLGGDGIAVVNGGGSKKGVFSAKNVYVAGGAYHVGMTFDSGKNGYGIYASSTYEQVAGRVDIVSSCLTNKDVGVFVDSKKTLTVSGGLLAVTLHGPKSVALNADKAACTTTISGGSVILACDGSGAKGIKSDGAFVMTGGSLNATMAGDASIDYYQDSTDCYYTVTVSSSSIVAAGTYPVQDVTTPYAVKCGSVNISGGSVRIAATGVSSRGIGADYNMAISGGEFDISVAGSNTVSVITLVDEDAATLATQLDRSTACCLKQSSATGTVAITGGTLYLTATGNGGKCLSCTGSFVMGTSGQTTKPTDASFSPDIQATTYGTKIYVGAKSLSDYSSLGTPVATASVPAAAAITDAQVTSASGESVDYTNPKALKAEVNVTVHGGRLRFFSKNDGGEGIESKADMTINGGIIEGTTYDDCINAENTLTVNGGYLYCGSTGNDGIDSNGSFIINGGVVLAFTLATPEVGIDVNASSYLKINGGIVFSCGSATTMAYSGSGTQNAYLSTSTSASTYAGKYVTLNGTSTTVHVPAMSSTSGSISLLCSAPGCTASAPSVSSTAPTTGAIGFHGVYAN